MKVKKYIAPTMPEAMSKIRKELGNDAVILNSKVIYTGGILGLFKKRNIEVIAAIDPDIKKQPLNISKEDTIAQERKPSYSTVNQTNDSQQTVLDEVRSLRRWMEKANVNQHISGLSPVFETVYTSLIEQDVSESIAMDLVAHIQQKFKHEELTVAQAKRLVQSEIKTRLDNIGCGGIQYDKQFIHLVGPTGVGKTTTIAKIAAKCMLKDNKSVAFITTDTYRIAAIEQLKTYSKILDIPLEVAYSIDDFKKAKEKFKVYDLVLVDTAGRNFRDAKYVEELGAVVDLYNDIDTYLVLSLTTKPNDLIAIYQQFKNIPLKQLIFTKSDETASYGSILNVTFPNDIGIGYITTGQDVPNDILEVTGEKISNLVVEESK
ncbi:Flagellar biosynthesis protein FlhF [Paraliobacillus sp. PM-2]|uniref:flagellar biosynthesis protein FlhF n=1 Tax=Paraliobacillus sp. PM-2 TaxID=1462524 RepID=UPI00061CC39B|nr:flagellar biosynthesis protein FlhF [Paraliobacillus sp. PM-2]CQR47681.1 Flagellar biosynthesis protein FlhF [Paraliobacillus sp. PM-2]